MFDTEFFQLTDLYRDLVESAADSVRWELDHNPNNALPVDFDQLIADELDRESIYSVDILDHWTDCSHYEPETMGDSIMSSIVQALGELVHAEHDSLVADVVTAVLDDFAGNWEYDDSPDAPDTLEELVAILIKKENDDV